MLNSNLKPIDNGISRISVTTNIINSLEKSSNGNRVVKPKRALTDGLINIATKLITAIPKVVKNKNERYLFNGLQILNSPKSPANVKATTAIVLYVESLTISPKNDIVTTLIIISNALGKHFCITFLMNLPSMRDSLGCNDKKNEGQPIMNISIKIILDNKKGYAL